MEQNKLISSYLLSPYFVGVCLILTLLSAYFGFVTLTSYLLFLFLLTLGGWRWLRLSTKGLSATLSAPSSRSYPGQYIEIDFTLENQKNLPLSWLKLSMPYPPNSCLDIPDDFQLEHIYPEALELIPTPVLQKGFYSMEGQASLRWTSRFYAARRGVYRPQWVELYTGDGYGLGAKKQHIALPTPPTVVVYPKYVPVVIQPFFQSLWSATSGPQGTIEDVTLLRSTRDYVTGDSFKRINWRLAARGGELSVNQYQTIAPRSVYFFIDTTTFYVSPENLDLDLDLDLEANLGRLKISEGSEAFEDTLSVIGSLVTELFAQGMTVALYFPTDESQDDLSVPLSRSSPEECLLALSLCHCQNPTGQFSSHHLSKLLSAQSGSVYYVCQDLSRAEAPRLFEDMGLSRYSVLCHQLSSADQQSASLPSQISQMLIADLKEG